MRALRGEVHSELGDCTRGAGGPLDRDARVEAQRLVALLQHAITECMTQAEA